MAERKLNPGRMEAFSDGVIAVVITIMVLDLKVPAHAVSNVEGLRAIAPLLLIYLLSFVQVGIYWVNHHYMIEDVKQVSHALLWANLGWLFSLSLIPFATTWVGERGLSPFSIALYSVCCSLPAATWLVVSRIIARTSGTMESSGSAVKKVTSAALYLGAVPVAYTSQAAAIAMIAAVAVLWLIPPRRVCEQTREATSHPAPR
jgi:uncharacterized membrane protein